MCVCTGGWFGLVCVSLVNGRDVRCAWGSPELPTSKTTSPAGGEPSPSPPPSHEDPLLFLSLHRCTKVIISDCNDQIIPELAAIKTGVSIALCQLNENEEGPHRQEHGQGEGEGASGAVRRICSSDMCRGMACPRRDEGVDLNECEAIAIAESERLKVRWMDVGVREQGRRK